MNTILKSGSFYLKDKPLTDKLPLIEIPYEPLPQYISSFNLANPKSAEFTMEADINVPLLRGIAGIDLNFPDAQSVSAEFSDPYQEQRRKHKKKRINKKWAKRYGYVTKYRKWRIKDITLVNRNEFEFEATCKNIELITR